VCAYEVRRREICLKIVRAHQLVYEIIVGHLGTSLVLNCELEDQIARQRAARRARTSSVTSKISSSAPMVSFARFSSSAGSVVDDEDRPRAPTHEHQLARLHLAEVELDRSACRTSGALRAERRCNARP
jgi:hypothetical protein